MKRLKRNIKNFRQNFRDTDKLLLFMMLLMLFSGLLNIVSASSREAFSLNVSIYHYFFRHGMMIIIGLIGFLTIINFETKNYKLPAILGYIVIAGLLIYLLFTGDGYRGSKNWLTIAGIKFQPSEFAKPILIVSVSLLFEKFYRKIRTKNNNRFYYILSIILVGVVFPIIVFIQKDLGTSIIMLGILLALFLSGPILRHDKVKFVLGGVGVVTIVGLTLLISGTNPLTEEQTSRLNFFNPCKRYETSGYQTCNGIIAINDGGLKGLGVSKSKQKYSYIPEPHTDSVFAIIVEEYGFLISVLIFICYLIIIYRILKIAENAKTLRNRYIALGVAVYIFMHIFINLGGLFAVIPLTGVPLPFFSYGGTFTVTLICSIGIVQRIAIENKNAKIKIGEVL